MHWQVIIPSENNEKLDTTITIEAENWFSALRDGLDKQGVDGALISNMSCNINADKSVIVTDFVTSRVYQLKPIDDEIANAKQSKKKRKLKKQEKPKSASGDNAKKTDTEKMPPHKVFFERNDLPEDGGGIYYRERLLAVERGFSREEASLLVHSYFKQLRELGSPDETKLFITVHVFDHEFVERADRPAVAALTWKEWSPRKPKILFPLSGEAGVTFSKVPPPPSTGRKQQAKDEKPIPLTKQLTASPPSAESTEQPIALTSRRPIDLTSKQRVKPELKQTRSIKQSKPKQEKRPPRRISRPPPPAKSRKKEAGIEEKMVDAFERMQDIYKVKDHDGAAAFVLSLARELIKCDSGSAMLISPGKYELYIAAAEGPVADTLKGQQLSLRKGIVGFATRSSAVIIVSDPANDPRFHSNFDSNSGYQTKNVVCAPIQHEGHTLGVIELINSPRKDGFIQGEANILSYLGGALAEYISFSLPSREDDFSDRDFLEPMVAQKKKTTSKKKVATKKKTVKKSAATTTSSQVKKTGSTVKTKTPSKAKASEKKSTTRPDSPKAKDGLKTAAKSKKKKKKKRRK
jgi:GAF domain